MSFAKQWHGKGVENQQSCQIVKQERLPTYEPSASNSYNCSQLTLQPLDTKPANTVAPDNSAA